MRGEPRAGQRSQLFQPAPSARRVSDHGDDSGLRLPPNLAPVQTVVIAVKGEESVLSAVRELTQRLRSAGVRAEADERTESPFGRRSVDWELKGVPARIEVGPRDLADGTATLVRRASGGPKEAVRIDVLPELLPRVLQKEQTLLWRQSRQRRAQRTADVRTIGERQLRRCPPGAGHASRGRVWGPRGSGDWPSGRCRCAV